MKNVKKKFEDFSKVHQGLKDKCNCKFTISKYRMNPNFPKDSSKDFALLKVKSIGNPEKETK